ncbi:peptidoglycan binding protein CsiV [Shewanella sp. 202IG2-18]|uniref:CsiV family protein n=1 Tax=Parashewanella hymeniacidonis TaxID=2807618 RepID=UPI00195FE947|nr:peptidoglycan binding protein CsiV [Parashewanella hymeniacidonis]
MIRATSLALVALLATFSARAVDPGHWFEVEVYIFKRDTMPQNANFDAKKSQEQWTEKVKPIALRGNVDLISPIAMVEHILRPAVSCMHDDPIAQLHDLSRSLMNDCVDHNPIIQKRYPQVVPFSIGESKPITAYKGDGPTLLANSQSQFESIIKKIQRQHGVHNLLHMTWQQPMLSRRNAKAVHLFAGQDYEKQFQPDGFPVKIDTLEEHNSDENTQLHPEIISDVGSESDTTQASSINEPSAEAPPKQSPVWELDGKLNIYLQHYLYIQADLRLRNQGLLEHTSSDDELNEANVPIEHVKQAQHFLFSIPMVQNRRVRSGEIHYFDHPKMGMFIQIRKMKQPEEKPIGHEFEDSPKTIEPTQ